MTFLQSIILGIVQGLTEFLPVSSSGHLALVKHFFGSDNSGPPTFEIFLHLGTLLAVLLYFRKMLWDLVLSLFKWKDIPENQHHRTNRNLILYLIVATLATGVIYLIFGDYLESFFAKPLVVAFMLLITGAIVFGSDFVKNQSLPASSMGFIKSVLIGLAQGIGIMPGISRSGSTIAVSLFAGINRKDAATFSFLLSIPAILGANLKEAKNLLDLERAQLLNYLAGFLISFIVGYLVISLLIRLIQQAQLKYFAFWCWLVGLGSIVWIVSR